MTKRYSYIEMEGGIPLSPGVAIAQGLQILDIASLMATDNKDIDRMTKIATQWIDVGERLSEIMDEPEEKDDEDESEEKQQHVALGFSMPDGISEPIEGNEEDD